MAALGRSRCVVSRCINFKFDMPFVRCYKVVIYMRALWDLILWCSECDSSEVFLSLVVFRRRFHVSNLIDQLDYWRCDCVVDFYLPTYQRPSLMVLQDVETLLIPAASHLQPTTLAAFISERSLSGALPKQNFLSVHSPISVLDR